MYLDSTYIVVFNELPAAARKHATEHALALTQVNIFTFPVLDIHVEGVALEEELQVAVVL